MNRLILAIAQDRLKPLNTETDFTFAVPAYRHHRTDAMRLKPTRSRPEALLDDLPAIGDNLIVINNIHPARSQFVAKPVIH